ncbi:AAA family ATPase [Priestia megaterium]
MNETIEVELKVVREMWYNPDNYNGGYSCETKDTDLIELNEWNNFLIKGTTAQLQKKTTYKAKLEKQVDHLNRTSYKILFIYEELPTTREGQYNYLKSILTENQVKSIFDTYPDDNIIDLIQNDKFDYTKVHGIGEVLFDKIKAKVVGNLQYQQAISFMGQFGIKPEMTVRLAEHFNSAKLLVERVSENPYCLTEIRGIGFKKADAIALKMKFDKQSPHRIRSAIQFVLEEQSGNGHTYVAIKELLELVGDLLDVPEPIIYKYTKEENKRYHVVDEKASLIRLYKAEEFIAKKLSEFMSNSTELKIDIDKFIEEQEEETEFKLTDQQKSFLHNIKKNNVNLLVGYAGTGKTQLTLFLIKLYEKLGINYKLLSPTGKAARVFAGYTDRKVETIHKAIGMGRENQDEIVIKNQVIIIDEFSMVDSALFARLLNKCVNDNVRLLFIGDDSQIQAVSAGNVLFDMIHSLKIPTTKLDQVFRQKDGGILEIATSIRTSKKFIDSDKLGIFKYGQDSIIASVPQEKVAAGYKYYYKEMLKKFNQDDIMILSPTNKGNLGTVEINKQIQKIVNGEDKASVERFETVFKEGDYVINITNNNKAVTPEKTFTSIVNGDTGFITYVNSETKEVTVDFGHTQVLYAYNELNNLLHAWCISTHRSQGSGVKSVVMIMDKAHKFQSNMNLFYTGVTRCKEMLAIVGQAETINFAMKKKANLSRNTLLKEFLINKIN